MAAAAKAARGDLILSIGWIRRHLPAMAQPKIAFVGFGEAARCFASHLAAQTGAPIAAFCQGKTNAPPYSQAFRTVAAGCGVTLVERLDDLADADVIFSAVVVAVAAETGEAISRIVRPGCLVVDINAATPRTKKRVAAAVEARGGVFADANLDGGRSTSMAPRSRSIRQAAAPSASPTSSGRSASASRWQAPKPVRRRPVKMLRQRGDERHGRRCWSRR